MKYLLPLLLITINSFSQKRIQHFVQSNAAAIQSIDPLDTSFAAFKVFDKAISGKRVIMLGEQDHGDATAFLAKTKLIRYLHEHHGFNILAFESDFFALTAGGQQVKDTATLRTYLQQNLFPMWTYCTAAAPLFYNYLPQQLVNGTPLTVTGFDTQLHGSWSKEKLRKYLDTALTAERFPVKELNSRKQAILQLVDSLTISYGRTFYTPDYFRTMERYVEELIRADQQKQKDSYLPVLLNSLAALCRQTRARFTPSTSESSRDEGMAANLNWLVNEKYKHEKIIVWAANAHVMKNSQTVVGSNFFKSMGSYFCSNAGNQLQTYILGFASRQGMAGRLFYNGSFTVKEPYATSFENWIQHPFAFIDFTGYNVVSKKKEDFYLKGIDHFWNGYGKWTTAFDGIFYIQNMEACKEIQ